MGRWIRFENRRKTQKFRCSTCGKISYCRVNGNTDRTYCDYQYCPYCGDKMVGEEDGTDT